MKPSYSEIQSHTENQILAESFLNMAIFLMGKPSNSGALHAYLKINYPYLVKLMERNKHLLTVKIKDGADPKKYLPEEVLVELNEDGLTYLRRKLLRATIS